MTVGYNQPGVTSLVIDSVAMGGSPPVQREVIVLGDPSVSANKAKVDAVGKQNARSCPTSLSAQALTPFYMQGLAGTRFVVKGSGGSLFGITVVNQQTTTRTTSSPVGYLHFFDTNSLTGLATTSWLFAVPVSADKQNVIGLGSGGCDLSAENYALGSFQNGIVVVFSNVSNSTTTAAGIAVPIGVIWIL